MTVKQPKPSAAREAADKRQARALRILLVHPHDVWSPLEPWTIRVLQLARSLKRLGHEAAIAYFPRRDENRPHPDRWRGVPLIALDRRSGPLRLLVNTARLWRLARRADVVHIQKAFHWAAIPAAMAALLAFRPLHYDWDDWEQQIYLHSANPPSSLVSGWLWLLEHWLPKIADTVSVASARLRREAIACGMAEGRIWWAPVGADPEDFHPNQDSEPVRERFNLNGATVVYVGQLHGGQYVDLVLKAAFLVQRQIKHARFLIVGDGHRRPDLERLSQELGLSGVTFAGAVSRDEVPAFVAAADVCLAGFEDNEVTRCKSPLKVAEYLASGKAVVASCVGEVPRMIGPAGVLVSAGCAESLAKGILSLLGDPQRCAALGRSARERALGQFTWAHTAVALVRAYEAAADRRIRKTVDARDSWWRASLAASSGKAHVLQAVSQ